MTQHTTQDSQSELRDNIKSSYYRASGGMHNIANVETERTMQLIEAYVTTRVKEAERQLEANVRHDIVQLAPPCEHELNQEVEHKAYCGFINGIWQHWAVDNDMSYKPLTTTTNGNGE